MKFKKILSSVVAAAMAVTTFSAFSTTATAATTSDNILAQSIDISTWDSTGVITKVDISSGDISTTGADTIVIEGEWIDDSSAIGYASLKVSCYPEFNNYQQYVLYEGNVNDGFNVEVPLIGNYDVNLQGFNCRVTSVKYVNSDVDIQLERGVQEATLSAGGTNNMDIASGITLDWNATNVISASTLENLRFDGTESLVFTSAGTGNVAVATNNPWTEHYNGGIWNSGTSIEVPLTEEMKDLDIIINGTATVDVKVVDYGSKAVRFVLKIAEEDIDGISSVSCQLRNSSSYSSELTTTKCYKTIKANGTSISEDGYVYVVFAIKDIPGNFSFDEAIFKFDSERAATIF